MLFSAVHLGLTIAAALTTVIAVVVVLSAAQDRKLVRSFVPFSVCFTFWSILIALQSVPNFASSHGLFLNFLEFGWFGLPAVALHIGATWCNRTEYKWTAAVVVAYSVSFLLWIADFFGAISSGFIELPWGTVRRAGPWYFLYAVHVGACVAASWGISWKASRGGDPEIRLRAQYCLLGIATFMPLASTMLMANVGIRIFPLGSVGNILLVVLWAYAVVRHKLLPVDVVIMKVSATILTGFTLSLPVAGLIIWMQGLSPGMSSALVGISMVVAAGISIVLFSQLRARWERSLEESLFPRRRAARMAISSLSSEMIHANDSSELAQRVTRVLQEGFGLSGVALYRKIGDANLFQLDKVSLDTSTSMTVPEQLDPNGNVTESGWDSWIPVGGRDDQIGILAIGSKMSNAAVDESDHALLALIAGQLAITLRSLKQRQQIDQQRAEISTLRKRIEAENVILRSEVATASQFKDIIGASPELMKVLVDVGHIAPADVTVLVTGETGTGKELIARAIHHLSPRVNGPWICVNSPAIPLDLAESELFGHERGAFTGAVEARPGKFEMAHNGTLFLDEIADLPMALQVKLLRVLQEREVQRLGGHKTLKLNLRIVAATNRDLRQAVAAGQFREDLYFRLSAVNIHVPALRHRPTDIPILASYFLQRAATTHQKEIAGFASDAMSVLQNYHWPGNIRELQHLIERATLLCTGDRIRAEHLGDLATTTVVPSRQSLHARMNVEKRRRVESALAQSGGNQAAAARSLGMSRSNLGRLMKSLGLKEPGGLQ